MSKTEKKTAQDFHHAYLEAWEQLSPQQKLHFEQLPENWDDLTPRWKSIFQSRADVENEDYSE